jgi:arsenical pump membrane protein
VTRAHLVYRPPVLTAVAVLALVLLVGVAVGWSHRAAPAVGAAIGVAVAAAGGLVDGGALSEAGRTLWRPLVTITAVMLMTAAARELGVFDRLAAYIEPRTRGPVRDAFRGVFVLAAVAAALLSNDAAILVLTPAVLTLLKTVYPRRHPRFQVPFAFAVFYAAGVAPLVVGNPMNLVVAERAGIGFNAYALHMIPVALAGGLTSYLLLARMFRDVLSDVAPALGAWPTMPPLPRAAWVVVAMLGVVLVAYPVVSFLDGPLWVVAASGAVACALAAATAGVPARALAGGVSWEILPFLAGVLVVAGALERVGAVDLLAGWYTATPAPLSTIAGVAALGSAVLNNHPMALLGALALERSGGDHTAVMAALIGGDLGPRLLPIGSLAGLLWLAILRRQGVTISFVQFVRIGLVVTPPALIVSVAVLWLVTR